jgi:hypothetical protein
MGELLPQRLAMEAQQQPHRGMEVRPRQLLRLDRRPRPRLLPPNLTTCKTSSSSASSRVKSA